MPDASVDGPSASYQEFDSAPSDFVELEPVGRCPAYGLRLPNHYGYTQPLLRLLPLYYFNLDLYFYRTPTTATTPERKASTASVQ